MHDYPTTNTMYKMLGDKIGDQKMKQFETALTVLYVWYNTTCDLCRRMRDVGRMLGVRTTVAWWPAGAFETPNVSSDSDDGSSDEDTANESGGAPGPGMVSATASESIADMTPLRSSVSMEASGRRLPDQDRASFYGKFVAKSMRLRGMKRVLSRLDDMAGHTLAKARLALEIPFEGQSGEQASSPRPEHPRLAASGVTPRSRRYIRQSPVTYVWSSCVNETGSSSDTMATSSTTDAAAVHFTPRLQRASKSAGTPIRSTIVRPIRVLTDVGLGMANLSCATSGSSESNHAHICKVQGIIAQQKVMSSPEHRKASTYGVHCSQYKSTSLPSPFYSYLFLLRVSLDLVHHWLILRVQGTSSAADQVCDGAAEQHSSCDDEMPQLDVNTLRQLIRDAHDCLEAAVEVKCYYQDFVQATVDGDTLRAELLLDDLSEFDANLKRMFKQYLEHVADWGDLESAQEHTTAEWSQDLLRRLEEEWRFAKRIAISVENGEAAAAQCFCKFGQGMYSEMVGEYLSERKPQLLEEVLKLDDGEPDDDASSTVASSRRRRDTANTDNTDEELYTTGSQPTAASRNSRSCTADSDALEAGTQPATKPVEIPVAPKLSINDNLLKQPDGHGLSMSVASSGAHQSKKRSPMIFLLCRAVKKLVREVRERTMRASNFSRLLKNDLEICAKYDLCKSLHELLILLKSADFVMIVTPSIEPDTYLLFCEEKTSINDEHLQLLLNVTCGRDECDVPPHLAPLQGYLLMVKCHDDVQKFTATQGRQLWLDMGGKKKSIDPDPDTSVSLQYMQVDAVYLAVVNSKHLESQRRELSKHVNRDYLSLVEEQCSCHEIIAQHMDELKGSAVEQRALLEDTFRSLVQDLRDNKEIGDMDVNELQTYRDTLMQAFVLTSEYHRELSRLVGSKRRRQLASQVIQLVSTWTDVVAGSFEDIDLATKQPTAPVPRWAHQPLFFLQWTLTKEVTSLLDTDKLVELRDCTLRAIQYATASAKRQPVKTVASTSAMQSLDNGFGSGGAAAGTISKQQHAWPHGIGHSDTDVSQSTEEPSRQQHLRPPSAMSTRADRMRRIRESVAAVEDGRQNAARSNKRAGRVVACDSVPVFNRIKNMKAPFSWKLMEREPLGAGRFGVVLLGYNIDKNEMIAVKVIKDDRKKKDDGKTRALVDEIKNLTAIRHPNLVRYYGVEVYRDEVFIFMEYCSEGTLESVCREGELPSDLVRKYTLCLLKAVDHLHQAKIVHRDIKPANIFLVSGVHRLKLGDFGNSARLDGDTTAAGELQQMAGTYAYMAPEMCTSGRDNNGEKLGYGRPADIWSVGCVVLHMATGKRPFGNKEGLAIVFYVGNGNRPDVPKSVGPLCRNFLNMCFNVDQKTRATAVELIEDKFVKVSIEREESLKFD